MPLAANPNMVFEISGRKPLVRSGIVTSRF